MNQSTPIFQNSERAAYELGDLLRHIPAQLHGASMSAEILERIQAADTHAMNSTVILLDGLQSMGRVMYSACLSEAGAPDIADCARVGMLATEIALQLEFMNDFRREVAEHNVRIAHKGAKS
jgi:hypothetical protein